MAKFEASFISLFSGCGGFDIGIRKAGFKPLGAFDIDKVALDNLHRYSRSPTYLTDLSQGTLSQSDYNGPNPDLILSGSPCQGFSTIGKRIFDDPRNELLLSGARIALNMKPRIFITENVLGVISGRHKEYWDKLNRMLNGAGYRTSRLTLNANEYGTPQIRKRIFLIAYRGEKAQFDIQKKHGGTLADALSNINEAKNHEEIFLASDTKEYSIANRIEQGQKLSNVRGGARAIHTWQIPEVFGKTTKVERDLLEELLYLRRRIRVRDFGDADPVPKSIMVAKYSEKAISSLLKKNYIKQVGNCVDIVGSFNGKFRRLKLDEPSCTVDTRFGHPENFLHPLYNRGFTIREAARIQSFPDSYVFTGSKQEQYRMIGNAVPPALSYILGKSLKKYLQGD